MAIATKSTRMAKLNKCVCGCGTMVRKSFAQGHDQRVRGMLARGESNKTLAAALHKGLVIKAHVGDSNGRVLRLA